MIILERIAKRDKLFSKKAKENRLNKAKRPKILKAEKKETKPISKPAEEINPVKQKISAVKSNTPLKSNVITTQLPTQENNKVQQDLFLLDDTVL